MLAFKLAIFDQCQCILLCVRILLAKDTPFSTTSETLSYVEIRLNYLGSVGLSGVFWDVLGFFRNLWSSMGFYDVMFMVFIWIFLAFFSILLESFAIFKII